MTEEILKEELEKIKADYENAKRELYIKYAKSQEKFKVGDIIKDCVNTILIDRITCFVSFGIPMPAYRGKVLKKDLTQKKNKESFSIYGNNGVELIEKSQTERGNND